MRSSYPSVAAEVKADATALDGNGVQAHVLARRILYKSIFLTVTAPCELIFTDAAAIRAAAISNPALREVHCVQS